MRQQMQRTQAMLPMIEPLRKKDPSPLSNYSKDEGAILTSAYREICRDKKTGGKSPRSMREELIFSAAAGLLGSEK